MIRRAERKDVPAILEIYAPYIRDTAITFEWDVPGLEEFEQRFERISARYPYLVWEEQGSVLGYAYADAAFERRAYAWDVDLSIYLAPGAQGRGIGARLYGCLEEILKRYGYHNLYALVVGENVRSTAFHERRGYERLGTLKDTGWKKGRWLDVHWYGLRLCEAGEPGEAPKAFACSQADRDVMEKYSMDWMEE